MTFDKSKFEGIFPALLTPFTSDGRVNEDALRALVRYNLDKGVQGFYVNGSTAEVFLLSDEERRLVYRTVADEAKGKATLIAQVGAISTEAAISFARYAQDLGYDAISAVAPFYYKFSFAQIRKHYYDIVSAVDLPMIIYNIPTFTGVSLTVDQVGEFFCDERFIGMKHTATDFFALEQFKTRFPDKVIYNGFDEMMLSGLAMGADGGIGSTYNFMAEKFLTLARLFREHRVDEALAVQKECNRIITALCKVGVMEGEKEVLNQLGIPMGDCRPPFSVLTPEQKEFLRAEITSRL